MQSIVKGCLIASVLSVATPVWAEGHGGGTMVMKGVKSVTVELGEQTCVIERNQVQGTVIHPAYAKTGQGTPQPMTIAPGIETLGEIEFIKMMEEASVDDSILVLDTRTENWHNDLRIPCTTNVSFKNFADNKDDALFYLTEMFGVSEGDDGSLNFDNAKTLVGYCNGYWCGQTPSMFARAAFSLVSLGYPADKLKYYRGGMQAWTSLGLSVEGNLAE